MKIASGLVPLPADLVDLVTPALFWGPLAALRVVVGDFGAFGGMLIIMMIVVSELFGWQLIMRNVVEVRRCSVR